MSAHTLHDRRHAVVRCRRESLAYYRIANHYRWVFQQLFDCFQYDRVIVVEDDMVFAPDFFSYFEATSHVLDQVRNQHHNP